MGNNAAAGTDGIAIGENASNGDFSSSVAIGANSTICTTTR